MTEHEQANQQTEPGQQEPTPRSQAEATQELSDEQLDQVAGGAGSVGSVGGNEVTT